MQKWPLPNLDRGGFPKDLVAEVEGWYKGNETNNVLHEEHPKTGFPKGWSNPWPDLPIPDEKLFDDRLDNIFLSRRSYHCNQETLLGYYIAWHIVGVSFENENGRRPNSGEELKDYNDTLPEENRFGIHICCNTIEEYIKKFTTDGLDQKDIPAYLDYCTFLTLIYVIAHEWGHYRSEVLSFQIGNLARAVTGQYNNALSPSYLSYFIFKKAFPDSNFEEVFAEYTSLKLGVFNYYMKKPAFASSIPNWPRVEATLKYMLTQAISRPSRIRPYSDIRLWVDFNHLSEDIIINRILENKPSTNRSVNDNVLIDHIKSLKNGKIIDLLMHNQMQFSTGHFINGLVRSAPLSYPIRPDSSFYHFGDDDCLEGKDPSCTDNFVNLSYPSYSDPVKRKKSRILNALEVLKEKDDPCLCLPMKVFPEILPLDPVYFHT